MSRNGRAPQANINPALLAQMGGPPQLAINAGPLMNDVQSVVWAAAQLASGDPSMSPATAIQRSIDLHCEAKRRNFDFQLAMSKVNAELKAQMDAFEADLKAKETPSESGILLPEG